LTVTYLKLVEYPEAVTDIPLGEDIFKIRDDNNAMLANYKKMKDLDVKSVEK
jgi:hypothetical protein